MRMSHRVVILASMVLCIYAVGVAAAPVTRFVIEDGTRDPKQYYNEKPDFIEKTWDLASEGSTSVHFRIAPKSNRGLITRFNWLKAQDFSEIAQDGVVTFDLYVIAPGNIRNQATGARVEFKLGSRSNEKFCGWMIGASLLKPKAWNHVVLRLAEGSPVMAGSSVNGVSLAKDPKSYVLQGAVDWTKVSYHRFQFPCTGGVEGYLDNCVAAVFVGKGKKQEVAFVQDEQPSIEGGPREEPLPPDVRQDAFFKNPDIDFSKISGWKAAFFDSNGLFYRSAKQAIRGVPNARIEARITGPNARIVLTPPAPIELPRAFDTVEAWVHGGDHAGCKLIVSFREPSGAIYKISGGDVQYWGGGRIFMNWMHYRNRSTARVAPAGTKLISIVFKSLPADKTCVFTLDTMRFTKFDLSGKPAPVFEHVGPMVKIPVSASGACPVTKDQVSTRVFREGEKFVLEYRSKERKESHTFWRNGKKVDLAFQEPGETVRYVVSPKTGTFSDITVEIAGQGAFKPAAGSGPVLVFNEKTFNTVSDNRVKARLVSADAGRDRVTTVWKYQTPGGEASITYTFRLMGKTLAVTSEAKDGNVFEWLFGNAEGLLSPKIIETPYQRWHPNVLLERGMFVSYLPDWYFANNSTVPYTAQNWVKGDKAGYAYSPNSKYRYSPRTDGSRHLFKERFYIAVSSDYDEVLPTVSNPPSPYKDILKKRLWLLVGNSGANLPQVRSMIQKFVDYGMTNMYFIWHAGFWSYRGGQGPEPFIGRMRNSLSFDKVGGTEAVIDFYRWLREQGFFAGYYEGYNFYQPISDFWREDWAAYDPDGNWLPTHVQSVRCKPWAFPELAATVSRARAEKYGANVVYMDGWTSHLEFENGDWDHRYPESGKMIDTIRAMACGYRNMRQTLNGPVFSEGNGRHYRMAGLNDGNYGQTYDPQRKKPTPLFVNFQLLKVHPLCADMGMGPYSMFAGNLQYDQINEFVTAEIAFGNMGIVEPYWRYSDSLFPVTLKTYFMVQQLQEQYIMEPVATILYSDGTRMMQTAEAVAKRVHLESMVYIKYKNGLEIFANCNPKGREWVIEPEGRKFVLPKGGFYARGKDGLRVFSAMIDERRVDFSDGPNYTYVYPAGKPFKDFGLDVPAKTHWIKHKKGPKAGAALTFVQN